MCNRTKLAALTLTIMLGGVALAYASPSSGMLSRDAQTFNGYVDTQSIYGPLAFTLRVDSYSSASDLRGLATLLQEKGQNALFAALGEMKPIGWLQIDHRATFPVAAVSVTETARGRQIVALVNRPLAAAEFWWQARSRDYPFGLVVLDLDRNGSGSGSFTTAAQAGIDRHGRIELESYRALPHRILAVREVGARS